MSYYLYVSELYSGECRLYCTLTAQCSAEFGGQCDADGGLDSAAPHRLSSLFYKPVSIQSTKERYLVTIFNKKSKILIIFNKK